MFQDRPKFDVFSPLKGIEEKFTDSISSQEIGKVQKISEKIPSKTIQ